MAELEPERECRICRGEDELDRPLLHPCRCSGSIKYTHEDCLVNWLAQSGSSRCELCNHSFRFEPLYQPNTPSALPTKEFILGVLALVRKSLKTAARIVLVFTVWLFFLPVGTCWTWYALFINSPSQLPALLASRGPAGVVTDAFYGCLLSAGIVFVFLGVSSLRDYVRQFPQDGDPANEDPAFDVLMVPDDFEDYSSDDARNPQHELNPDNPRLDAHNDQIPNVQRAPYIIPNANVDIPPILVEPPNRDNDEVFDEVDDFMRDTYDVFAGGADDSDDDELAENRNAAEDSDDDHRLYDRRGGERRDELPMDNFQAGDSDAEYDASGSDSDFVEEEDIDPLVGPLPPYLHNNVHNEMHVDQVDDAANEDENNEGRAEGGALFALFEMDPDEIPLEEVVGLRGHIRNLFDNAGTVLVSNAIFLGIFTLIPLLVGRLTLRLFSMHAFPLNAVLYQEGSSIYDFATALLRNTPEAGKSAHLPVTDGELISILQNETFISTSTHTPTITAINDVNQQALLSSAVTASTIAVTSYDEPLVSYVDNFLIVLLGYGMIALLAVGYIAVISMLRQRYPRVDSPVTRQIARMLRYVATFVKIVVLILFEFGIFPLGCGWWLDICTLEILGGSLPSRLAYCRDSPWTCTGGHWVLGIIYMVHISLFISLLREVVKPELLWFLRNPDDPEFHPFRELVEKPLSRHARRMCISVFIYVPLILALVYVPGQLCLKFLPNVFPFRSEDFSHILIDVPFGNLLIGPLIRLLYFGRTGISLHKLVGTWVRWVSTVLGIAHLVVRDDDGEGNADHRIRDRQNDPIVDAQAFENAEQGPMGRMFADRDEMDGVLMPNEGETSEPALSETSIDSIDGLPIDYEEGNHQYIRLRGAIMIVLAWLTLIFAESALLAIPTVLGRSLMTAVGLPVRHDLHPFLLGLNVLFGSVAGLVKVVKYVRTVGTIAVLSRGLPYLYLAGKGTIVIVLWLGVIPLAAGLLFELILVPIRVSHNETPYFCLHQDWALGLLLLKVWSCIAVTGGLGGVWRERVLRAREGDIIGLDQNFWRTMREVVIPVLISVVTALSVPYSVARGLLPVIGLAPWVSNVVYRYAYLVIACLLCGFESFRYSISIFRDLHDSIRDDKYLVGKRLYNFIDSSDSPTPAQR